MNFLVYNEVTKGMNLLNRVEGERCVLVIPPTHIGSQIGTGGLVVRWRRHSARCHNARCKNVFLFFLGKKPEETNQPEETNETRTRSLSFIQKKKKTIIILSDDLVARGIVRTRNSSLQVHHFF